MKTTVPSTLSYPLIEDQLWLTLSPNLQIVTLHFSIQKTRNAISSIVAEKLFHLSFVLTGNDPNHPISSLVAEGRLLVIAIRSHCPGVFLSGGDLKEIAQFTVQQGNDFIKNMRSFTHMLRTGPLVSIALLNGTAAGGGSEIALSTDLRLAVSSSAMIHFAQTYWGVPAGWGMMSDLKNKSVYSSERRRGIALAAQEKFDLPTLQRLQLIDEQFDGSADPIGAGMRWIDEFTSRLTTCPPALKEDLIFKRPRIPDDKLEEYDKNLFHQHWLSSEHRARVTAKLATGSLKPKEQ